MPLHPRPAVAIALLLALSGCVPGSAARRSSASPAPPPGERPPLVALAPVATASASTPVTAPCVGCVRTGLSAEEASHVARRIAALKERGAPCATYAEVLERSLQSGRITIRPFMWRVGHQLVSGEAYPDGAIYLAREIDPLNVGLRSFDELVWSMEHEAAHIALQLDAPFDRAPGDRADAVVRSCRS